jgi:hypothetical protein
MRPEQTVTLIPYLIKFRSICRWAGLMLPALFNRVPSKSKASKEILCLCFSCHAILLLKWSSFQSPLYYMGSEMRKDPTLPGSNAPRYLQKHKHLRWNSGDKFRGSYIRFRKKYSAKSSA